MFEEKQVRKAYDSVSYLGERDHTRALIALTISRLPKEVAYFALESCIFISIGSGVRGLTFPGRITEKGGSEAKPWIIVVHDDANDSDDEACTTIAHEIAHAHLGHDRLGDAPPTCEKDAASLAYEWGFRGLGADVSAMDDDDNSSIA